VGFEGFEVEGGLRLKEWKIALRSVIIMMVMAIVHVVASLLFFAGCASPGLAEQSSSSPEDAGSYILNLRSLSDFEKMVRTVVPATERPWTSSLEYGKKRVYLTFDDGPKPYATQNVLDILDREHVKGTFFLIGRKAEERPEIVREIVRRGHTVGNHTYSHMMPWGKNRKLYVEDAVKGRKLLEEITGRQVDLFRPPGGTHRLMDEIEAKGMKIVLWTTLSGDCASGITPGYLLHMIKQQEKLRPTFHYPMIILMHDTSTRTAAALPEIIAYLKKRGYTFTADWP
jgi:peptidoglycan/xylan/chitin deacetylase (PgdA/CDA1 family)